METEHPFKRLNVAERFVDQALNCPHASSTAWAWIMKVRLVERKGICRAMTAKSLAEVATSATRIDDNVADDWMHILEDSNKKAQQWCSRGLRCDISLLSSPFPKDSPNCESSRANRVLDVEERKLLAKEIKRLVESIVHVKKLFMCWYLHNQACTTMPEAEPSRNAMTGIERRQSQQSRSRPPSPDRNLNASKRKICNSSPLELAETTTVATNLNRHVEDEMMVDEETFSPPSKIEMTSGTGYHKTEETKELETKTMSTNQERSVVFSGIEYTCPECHIISSAGQIKMHMLQEHGITLDHMIKEEKASVTPSEKHATPRKCHRKAKATSSPRNKNSDSAFSDIEYTCHHCHVILSANQMKLHLLQSHNSASEVHTTEEERVYPTYFGRETSFRKTHENAGDLAEELSQILVCLTNDTTDVAYPPANSMLGRL